MHEEVYFEDRLANLTEMLRYMDEFNLLLLEDGTRQMMTEKQMWKNKSIIRREQKERQEAHDKGWAEFHQRMIEYAEAKGLSCPSAASAGIESKMSSALVDTACDGEGGPAMVSKQLMCHNCYGRGHAEYSYPAGAWQLEYYDKDYDPWTCYEEESSRSSAEAAETEW